jgi:hypothetical protein
MTEEEQLETEKEFTLSDKLSDLENYYADNILTDELKELYATVQLQCADFRNNVFFKNVDLLDATLVRKNIIFKIIFRFNLIKKKSLILQE